MTCKSLISLIAASALLAVAAFPPALANNHVEPGKGPPDCPGTPGAFISSEAQALVEQETPPGEVVAQIARNPDGRGAGDTVREALFDACGLGALPEG